MRILLAQIDTTVGALKTNTRRIIETIEEGRRRGADLVIFPELTITGYPPKDLLEQPHFVNENLARLEEIAAAATLGVDAIVGFVDRRPGGAGKRLFNAAALCAGGRVVSRHHKTLIPTYDVFDEGRYFDSADERRVALLGRHRLGITICEDCWNDALYWSQRLYSIDPVEDLAVMGVEALINISASPYNLGKIELRQDMFAELARRHGRPLIHVNLVGGNDSLLFDGSSAVFGADGRLLARAASFEEQLLIVDVDTSAQAPTPQAALAAAANGARPSENMEELYKALAMGTRDYVRKCHFRKVIVGLSGGIDSALTAVIAAQALGPENVFGVSMPSRYSSDHSKDDAAALARNLGIDYRVIPIEAAFTSFLEMLKPSFEGLQPDITEENLQARIRGVTLMALSNKFGAMVLTTGNKSEVAVGYATLYGDMCGGLGVISDVPKTMVYELARWINRDRQIIPQSSLDKAPSAELRPGQFDTDSLPPYDQLDPILRAYVEDHKSVAEIVASLGMDRALVERVARMIDRSEYKRQQAAPGLRVTSKAFGYGRRMPIAAYD